MTSEGTSRKSLTKKFGRYAVVGLAGTAIHSLTTISLVELDLVAPTLASALGFLVTLAVSFYLNSRWTFGAGGDSAYVLVKYCLVSCSGLLLNTVIMYSSTVLLDMHYLLGLTLVVLIIPPTNFLLNLLWAFRQP